MHSSQFFFGFDMFFLIKGIRPSVWGTKDINIGSQVKFIETMKYFLTSLRKLASTLDDVEKV